MTLTDDGLVLDNLLGLTEEEMAERIPSNIFIAKAVPATSGKYHAVFSAPGLFPEVSKDQHGRPFEFNTAEEAETRAHRALLSTLNGPRQKARSSKPERYKKLTGNEFAVLLKRADLTPTFFAELFGTSQQRVMQWIDDVEDVPHPVRLLLEAFIYDRNLIDLAQSVTDSVTTSRQKKEQP